MAVTINLGKTESHPSLQIWTLPNVKQNCCPYLQCRYGVQPIEGRVAVRARLLLAQRLQLFQREVDREPVVVRHHADDEDPPPVGELLVSADVSRHAEGVLVQADGHEVLRQGDVTLDVVGAVKDGLLAGARKRF